MAVHLNYSGEIKEIVISPDVSESVQLNVLRQTVANSKHLMSYVSDIEIINEENLESITKWLRKFNIDIFTAVYENIDEAVSAAVQGVGVEGLKYSVSHRDLSHGNKVVNFTVGKPNRFIFWKSESVPNGDWDLHVVPPYHPVMNGWTSISMVNGATDANIRGAAIKSIYCPKAAQSDRHGGNFGSSWNHVKHPFYAIGRSMSLEVSPVKVLSSDGVQELIKVLRASLGLDKHYVDISGGFRAPMKCAHNRLIEIDRRSPWKGADYGRASGNVTRGSEEHCVWAYRTIKKEGFLDTSHVPAWFIPEGWLEIYEEAKVCPTLY